jgi:hypothetical protein
MPVAIPLGIAAASAIGGDISSNVAAKSANANADNKYNAAQSSDKKALQTALANLASYNKSNPSPASQYTMSSAPASVGGGVFSGNSGQVQGGMAQPSPGAMQSAVQAQQSPAAGASPASVSQLPPQVLQMIQQLRAKSAQPIARTANPNGMTM